MVNSNSKNSSTDNVDEKKEKTQKKPDSSITTQAIRQFVEYKLLGSDGGRNFDEIKSNKGNGLSDEFLEFIKKQPRFDERTKEQEEIFKNVSNTQFLRETLSIGAGFESKRKALVNLYTSEYVLDPKNKKQHQLLNDVISNKSLDELTTLLKSESLRDENLRQIF